MYIQKQQYTCVDLNDSIEEQLQMKSGRLLLHMRGAATGNVYHPRNLKREMGSLFDPSVNAMGRQAILIVTYGYE